MDNLKASPRVLLQKLLFTVLIGIGCLLVGVAYYIFARDRIFLALSGLVFLFSLSRGAGLYRMITKRQYEVVEGTCVSVAQRKLRKHCKIRIMDKDGIESTLLLGKQAKVKIGFQYRFYFSQAQRLSVGSEYFDTALSSDHFLGFEELGEFADGKARQSNEEAEEKCQTEPGAEE